MRFKVFNDENQFIELIGKMKLNYLYVEVPSYEDNRVKIISAYYIELFDKGVFVVEFENGKLKSLNMSSNSSFEKCIETLPNMEFERDVWSYNVFEVVKGGNKLNLHDMREDLHS